MTTAAKNNIRKPLLLIIFASFAAYSTWVMLDIGYFGIWQSGIQNSGTVQILWDLVIACLLICVWMKGDAEARGMNPYPWIIGTICTGTIAPLVYLIVREFSNKSVQSNAPKTA